MDGAASRTFFAEAAVGFMKLAAVLLLFVGRRVRGRVVETPALELEDPMVRRLLGALFVFRDMPLLLATELVLELDLLRFSLELVVRPLIPFVNLTLGSGLGCLLRLFVELALMSGVVEDDLTVVRRTVRGDSFEAVRGARVRVEELMLGWLPPFTLLIGLRLLTETTELVLPRGLSRGPTVPSSRPFRRFLVRSLEMSLIRVSVPLGLSGGRLVAREVVLLAVRPGREVVSVDRVVREVERLVRLPDFPPLDNRS